MLRRIYGGKTDKWWLGKKSNKEIYELLNEPLIDTVVKSIRLQWLGHLKRMDNTRKIWREALLEDIREKCIINWKEKAKTEKTGKKK